MSDEAIFQAKTPVDMTRLSFLSGDIRTSKHITLAEPGHMEFKCDNISMDFYGAFEYPPSGRVTGEVCQIIQHRIDESGRREVVFEWIGRADASMIYKIFQGNPQYPYGAVSYLMTGDDIIKGSAGDDVLVGGAGNDYIVGGGGRDIFVYQLTGNGVDTIADPIAGDIIRVNQGTIANVRTAQDGDTTVLTISTKTAPHTPITINLKGTFTADQFLIRGSDVEIIRPPLRNRPPAAPLPLPQQPPAAPPPIRDEPQGAPAEPPRFEPPAADRPRSPSGEIWHLMTLLIDARQGCVAPAGKLPLLKRDQVEALWDNLVNGWPVGMLVAVDTTGAETMPWPSHFGPWLIQPGKRSKRIRLAGGAEKIVALAWSLNEPSATLRNRHSAEESEIWSGYTLVADPGLRRAGFVKGPIDTRRQLPVWLLPQSKPCLDAINQMHVTPVEREWLNRVARRLMEARISVHLFPAAEQEAAQRMVGNFRQLGSLP